MATYQNFTYTPLHFLDGDIRILTLLSGCESSSIRCRLDIASLGDQPIYDALSYMWGEPDQLGRTIIINDKCFPVRANLWSALYNLRDTTADHVLWIDAICINQNNLKERSYQVRQMGNIFAQARFVRVWVGDKSDDSDIALSMLRELAHGSPCTDKWNKDLKLDDSWSKWNAVFNFLLRSYWSRVWIIQEIAMAREIAICCGQDTIPWEFLSKALSAVEYMLKMKHKIRASKWGVSKNNWATILSGICDTHPLQLDRQRALRLASHSDAFDIDVLLGISHRSSCSDLRDKLYGLLGLIQDSWIPIDYTRNLFQVFGDMIEHINQEEVRGLPLIRDFITVRFSQCCQSLLRGPHRNVNRFKQRIKVQGVGGDTISTLGPYYYDGRNGVASLSEAMRITAELYGESGKHSLSRFKARKEGRILMERLRGFRPVSVVKAIRAHEFTARKRDSRPGPDLINSLKSWNQTCELSVAGVLGTTLNCLHGALSAYL
jgi:Heterokaryon incompatibility protein (HET)